MAEARIGISGWRYSPWRGSFYPEGWPQRRELEYASTQVSSIEINGSFYSLQRPSSYQAWREETPEGFVFSVKGGRFITHMKKLRNVEEPLANFFASGVLALNEKLGPFLWQLPPSLPFDRKRLEEFFKLLPRDTGEAVRLAKKHDAKLKRDTWSKTDQKRSLRHALEVRHASFVEPDFVKLLREYKIGLVIADTAGKWPFLEDLTADFVYVRLHGDEQLYVSGYTDEALDRWAQKIRRWLKGENPRGAKTCGPLLDPRKAGRDVFVYFDNDVKVRAPYDALSLAHKLNLGPQPRQTPPKMASILEEPRVSWPAVKSLRLVTK